MFTRLAPLCLCLYHIRLGHADLNTRTAPKGLCTTGIGHFWGLHPLGAPWYNSALPHPYLVPTGIFCLTLGSLPLRRFPTMLDCFWAQPPVFPVPGALPAGFYIWVTHKGFGNPFSVQCFSHGGFNLHWSLQAFFPSFCLTLVLCFLALPFLFWALIGPLPSRVISSRPGFLKEWSTYHQWDTSHWSVVHMHSKKNKVNLKKFPSINAVT